MFSYNIHTFDRVLECNTPLLSLSVRSDMSLVSRFCIFDTKCIKQKVFSSLRHTALIGFVRFLIIMHHIYLFLSFCRIHYSYNTLLVLVSFYIIYTSLCHRLNFLPFSLSRCMLARIVSFIRAPNSRVKLAFAASLCWCWKRCNVRDSALYYSPNVALHCFFEVWCRFFCC